MKSEALQRSAEMASPHVELSLAQLEVAWYASDGGVDEVTFCRCLASGELSRGCMGFSHGSVRAAIQRLNATKCCAVDHNIYDPHGLLAQLPPEVSTKSSVRKSRRSIGPPG